MKAIIMKHVNIISFSEKYASAFANLNYEWIGHFFAIENTDRKYLDNPQTEIIDKGGIILLAECNNNIIGTIALVKMEEGVYELAKMSVEKEFRGKKIGHLLMEACISTAKELGAAMIVILSNRKLKNAIHLYQKFGFVDVGIPETDYERCDIRMELIMGN